MNSSSQALQEIVLTCLVLAGVLLPVLAVFVAGMPYATAWVVATMRRDPAGPFVAHSTAVRTRILAVILAVLGLLLLILVQPTVFNATAAVKPSMAEGGDPALLAAIGPDVQAQIDSLPGAGVVVGIVQPTGNQVFGFGRRSVGGRTPPDGETVFEIGGLTQPFTGALLARLAEKGTVRMDQPVKSLLTDTVSVPLYEGRPIEVQHLATLSSGLPRLAPPAAAPLIEMFPPFARAGRSPSVKALYDLLSSIDIQHPPGTQVSDSDIGMGLLGHALARSAETSYDALLQRELCGPLGLRDTRVQPSGSMNQRYAMGVRRGWGSWNGWRVASPLRRWQGGALPGASDLCSTANDMLILLRAHLAGFPLAGPLAETRRSWLRVAGRPDVGLGWNIDWTQAGEPIVWQRGAAGASRAYTVFLAGRGVGVVVLANAPIDVDLLGRQILNRLLAPRS